MEPNTANIWLVITGAVSAVAASIAVIISYCGNKKTVELAQKTAEATREQLKVELQLKREETFDSIPLLRARQKLARQLRDKKPHAEIGENVMNFFETIGMLLRKDFLEEEMVWTVFGYSGIHWWFACKEYIETERVIKNNDNTIFDEFQSLERALRKIEARERGKTMDEVIPSASELVIFLKEEAALDLV